MTHNYLVAIILIFTSCGTKSKPTDIPKSEGNELKKFSAGKLIFKKHCSTCHVPPDNRSTSDQHMFDNIFDRLPDPSEGYFIKFVQDNKKLKDTGDKYAKALDDEWSYDYEHLFKDSLTQEDIQDIIIYVRIGVKSKEEPTR